jgi:hypothetical protein
MNKQEHKVLAKIVLSLYAEHLYDGLTANRNYGLVEATRHWQFWLDYGFIEFPGRSTSVNDLCSYFAHYDENVKTLEDYLAEQGTLDMTYEQLEALEEKHEAERKARR